LRKLRMACGTYEKPTSWKKIEASPGTLETQLPENTRLELKIGTSHGGKNTTTEEERHLYQTKRIFEEQFAGFISGFM